MNPMLAYTAVLLVLFLGYILYSMERRANRGHMRKVSAELESGVGDLEREKKHLAA